MFALGAHVALERVHLDLDALVFALGLRRFATVDEQNDDRDEHQEHGTARDAADGLGRERVRLDHLVTHVTYSQAPHRTHRQFSATQNPS